MEQHVGKTIERVEQGEHWITLYFTDGSEVTIYACGTEEQWISVET